MEDSWREQIRVEPFIHQVGGHSLLLCLDEHTICKPLVPRELEFYQSLPESLRPFVPQFYGVIEIRAKQDDDGYITFFALPPKNYKLQSATNGNSNGNKVRLRRSGSVEVIEADELFTEDESSSSDENARPMNPWVLTCHRTNLHKDMLGSPGQPNFIVLENLATRFRHPCILDLKMGTQQYGDSASLAKKQSKMYKVVSSTSGKLGVRIGGMQVYQVSSRRYLCRDKFYGRSLTPAGFMQALRQFIHNGSRPRLDVLQPLIRRLEELAAVLTREDSVRFYTTSLLVLYEGEDKEAGGETDPAWGPEVQEELKRSSSAELLSPLPTASTFDFAPLDDMSLHRRRRRSSTNPDSPRPGPEPAVDVRIIDFAHTTYRGVDDPIAYSGPDRGFLFGLENLVAYLRTIERECG